MSAAKSRSSKEDVKKSPRKIFVRFPDVVNDRNEKMIDTKKFLTASRGVVKVIDKFGKLFAPLKYDMQGNIEKLSSRYLTDKEVNATLQDMLLLEIAIGETMICTEALVWLTRELHMLQVFFEKIVNFKCPETPEDLGPALKKTYEETLEPFHGWMAKQLFGLLVRMVPTRTHFLQILAHDAPGREESTLHILAQFTRGLKKNIQALNAFFEEHNLDSRNYITL